MKINDDEKFMITITTILIILYFVITKIVLNM